MAEVVITIPDEVMETGDFKDYFESLDARSFYSLIRNGTVLPKGHGALKDVSKIIYFRCPNNVKDCPPSYDFTCQKCDYGICHQHLVNELPTLVEADKN